MNSRENRTMGLELKVPQVGESITEVEIGRWLKAAGESVQQDEPLVEIETDKVTVELPAPEAGVLSQQLKKQGEQARVGEVIGYLDENGQAGAPAKAKQTETQPTEAKQGQTKRGAVTATAPKPEPEQPRVMPAAQRLLDEHGLTPGQVQATGPGGRLLKQDVLRHIQEGGAKPAAASPASAPTAPPPGGAEEAEEAAPIAAPAPGREEEAVPMSPLRRRIAQRLVEAQQNAAMLTTFNEVDMQVVMDLRTRYRETFEKRYGFRLGFMSFFVKAAIDALKQFPAVNAEIRGQDIVYKNYHDIGIAVSTERGLVVPVLKSAERKSFAEIEQAINDFAKRARDNKLQIEELQGGTFTITNGGVFGSLMSTPILNPPQSGVLGMHTIQQRPVAIDGEVRIRPMMYVALTYDHRVIDGREAVSFLRRLKEAVEDPARMLVEV
ncbi:MAG: 2-oxoglutarate dehydrogenase complex dihydrolipoyllysine-residue succinyltransferase [Phycisphaeraceae bacterium]